MLLRVLTVSVHAISSCLTTSTSCLNSLLDNPLNAVQALLQHIHSGAITQSDEVMTRTVKQISSSTWIQIEEDTRDYNDLLFQTRLEEI